MTSEYRQAELERAKGEAERTFQQMRNLYGVRGQRGRWREACEENEFWTNRVAFLTFAKE